jgi:hypothetical protein
MSVAEDRAWDQVMDLAKRHGLIAQAYGGTAILLHPDEQREQGIYEQCRKMSGLTAHDEQESLPL